MRMFSFWRSNASFRVRIACNLKGIPLEEVPIDLDLGEQHAPDFLAMNPQAALPALFDGDGPALTESLAILEYLDETHPAPPLLPEGARARARVRSLAQVVACDSHPLIVPRIRQYLLDREGFDLPRWTAWQRHWLGEGMAVMEQRLSREPETGRYCHGDTLTIADICLVAHAVSSAIFGVALDEYPTAHRIVQDCLSQDAFARAHPKRQPGAPV